MKITDSDLQLLNKVPLLCELAPPTLAAVTSAGLVQRQPRGAILFNQGRARISCTSFSKARWD